MATCRVPIDPQGSFGVIIGTSMTRAGIPGYSKIYSLVCGEANSFDQAAASGILQDRNCCLGGGWCKGRDIVMGLLRNVLFRLFILRRTFSF